MVDEVLAATHGNKVHVYWRNFQLNRWVDFSDGQHYCKLMIFERRGDYFVKITTEDNERKVFEYVVPRDVQVIDTEGLFQFPVMDPRDTSGGKLVGVRFREPGEADFFRMKVAKKIGGFSMPQVAGFRQAPVHPSPPQERKVIDSGPSQWTYNHPVQPSAVPLPGPGRNVSYQAPAAAPGQQRRDGYAPASIGFQSEGVRGMGSRQPPPPHHQQQQQQPVPHLYHQHSPYRELPVNDMSDNFSAGAARRPTNRADVMAGMNQQHQFYNHHHQQQQQPPYYPREGLGEHQIRYNPPVQPQPVGIVFDQWRGLGGGVVHRNFQDMGPTPRKQNQQGFGMDYRQQQQQHPQEYIEPLERELAPPQLRHQGSQHNMAFQLAEAINTGNMDLAQRLTRILTLDNQRQLSQGDTAATSSGAFSMTWEPCEKPDAHKLHDIEVIVESQKGERYPLYLKAKSDYTFAYLKSVCDRQFRIPALSQYWVVNEQVVDDTQSLAEVGITGQGTVYVYVMHSVRAKIPEERMGNLRTGQPGQAQQQHPPQQQHPSQQDHHHPSVPSASHQAPPPSRNTFQTNDLGNPGRYPVGGYPLEQPAMYRGAAMGSEKGGSVLPQQRHQEVGDVQIWAMPSCSPSFLNNTNHHCSPDPPNTSQMEVSWQDQQHGGVKALPPSANPQQQLAQILRQGQPPPLRQQQPAQSAPAPPPAAPPEQPQVGWKCSSCTYINKPFRPGCEMCDSPRPNDYVPPPGYVPDESERKWADEAQQQEVLFQKMVEEEKQRQERERVENYQRLMQAEDEPIVTNEAEFDCPVCFIEIPPGDGLRLKSCLHMICKECIKASIMHSEEVEIKCPCGEDCDELVSEREMRAVLTVEEMQEVHMRGLRKAEAASADSFHCRTPDCPGFCFYEDEVNEYRCQNCESLNCILCKAIHEGMNCQQYQDDLKRKANNDDAAKKTQEMLEALVKDGEAMHCPGCKVIVTKKVGCDWIRCSVCKTEMCWATKGPRWGPGGRGDTSGGCRCGLNGKRCSRKCRNCH